MPYQIRRAAVIGSGTMGGGIAAHLANIGIPVDLFDIVPFKLTDAEEARGLTLDDPQVRYRIVNAGWEAQVKARPAALFTQENADLVRLCNLEDDFDRLAEADYILEAIVENLTIKQELMARLEKIRRPETIIATNTSGIPIKDIAEGRSQKFQQHFLGMHFFNPPRYLKLLEIIPHTETLPGVIEAMSAFGRDELGKGVVVCKDTPNFIGNRIFTGMLSFEQAYAIENGYTVDEIDTISGPLIGRPKSATFRLIDLIGLDVMAHVNENLYDAIPQDESRELLRNEKVAAIIRQMVENGWLGNKTKQGFYKQVMVDGKKEFWTLNLETMEHAPPGKVRFDSVGAHRKTEPTGARIKALAESEDRAGEYIRNAIYNLTTYAARRVPEIADDLVSIDNAVRWGFVHELGPFEMWDALGVKGSIEKMEAAGFPVADWVKEMVAGGHESFYRYENGIATGYYSPQEKKYLPLEKPAREIGAPVLIAQGKLVDENDDARLVDMGDGIALFQMKTKANTFTLGVIEFAHQVIDTLGDRFDGLVIGNEGDLFSAGANLDIQQIQKLAAESGMSPNEFVDANLFRAGQEMMMGFRYAPWPVVAAPHGLTLGGGCEITMAADRIVAHSELYIGLVEVGVGLIPGWSGCKEMLRRVVNPVMRVPNADPLPPLVKVFERIGLAQVATSAAEAREAGFLGPCDRIITNKDQLLYEAKREARHMADNGYRAPKPEKIWAGGRDILAAMQTQIYMLHDAGYASDYDAEIANKLACILAGGDLSAPAWVDEWYILDLEREAIGYLMQQPRTVERIFHTLSTGKPLRN